MGRAFCFRDQKVLSQLFKTPCLRVKPMIKSPHIVLLVDRFAIDGGKTGGWCFFMSYPPTRRQLMVSVGFFTAGVSLFAVGAYLSLENIGPQQDRVKARNDFVKNRIRKWLDD